MDDENKGRHEMLEKDCPDIIGIDQVMLQDSKYINTLIESFNREVGNRGWCSARATYLAKLYDAFLASGLDCSDFIDKGSMKMSRKVYRQGNRLFTIL